MSDHPPASHADIERAAARWIGRRDAGMSPGEELEFERWRGADVRHALAFERHAQTWRAFDWPRDAGQAEMLMGALAASKTRRRARRVQAVAAGAAVCLLAVCFGVRDRFTNREEGSLVATAGHAAVTAPEKRRLEDGSVVELKPGARISTHFTAHDRRITLEGGEAYFQVAKASRPFVVAARGVEVRALGTEFSVDLGQQAVEVIVTEGVVTVEKRDVASAGALASEAGAAVAASSSAHRVEASNRLIVDLVPQATNAPVVATITELEMKGRLAWRAPRLEFTDTPLASAVELFNRHSEQRAGHRLVIDANDRALARMEVSGYFRADNVEAFIILVEQTLGIKAERQGDRILLRRMR